VYLTKFPSSKFVGIEPDPVTAAFNIRNLAFNYANISHWPHGPWNQLAVGGYTIIAGAVGSSDSSGVTFERLRFSPSGSGLRKCTPGENVECIRVVVVSLKQLIGAFKITGIPWLKIDCEGCEFDSFCNSPESEIEAILAMVKQLGGEVHLHRNTFGLHCAQLVLAKFKKLAKLYVVQSSRKWRNWTLHGVDLPVEGIPHTPFRPPRVY
jgi:FkbM family methyltransferase